MTPHTFDHGMRLLIATWPDRPLSEDTLVAYQVVLEPLHDSTFEAAIMDCLRSCTYFPKPVEILGKAEALLTSAGLLPPQGEAAWAELQSALRDYSPDTGWLHPWQGVVREHHAPNPLPPLIDQAVRAIGGLNRVWLADQHEIGFIHREFVTFYDHRRATELRHVSGLMCQALPAATSGLLGSR